MRFSIFRRKPAPPVRDDTRSKSIGAREYDARFHDRAAARLAAEGDEEGAEKARALSAEARRPGPLRRDAGDKGSADAGPLPGSPHGVYRIYHRER